MGVEAASELIKPVDSPKRQVFCQDALEWLTSNKSQELLPSYVASLPDISEFPGHTLEDWQAWFISSAQLILSSTAGQAVTIFYQSDIKLNGLWVDKSYLCLKAAEAVGARLLWHKVACRYRPGTASFGRPAYSHILCFSHELQPNSKFAYPDVLSTTGEKSWERGMGVEACVLIAKFISQETKSRLIINPFCGQGSMLAAANYFGLNAIGIERSKKRAAIAEKLQLYRRTEEDLQTGSSWSWIK